jgi:hypothetical protein
MLKLVVYKVRLRLLKVNVTIFKVDTGGASFAVGFFLKEQ